MFLGCARVRARVCLCVTSKGMGPSEGVQPGPEAVGDRKDHRGDVEGPDRRGETGLPERVRSREGGFTRFWSVQNQLGLSSLDLEKDNII